MTPAELAALWEVYLRMPSGSLAGKAPDHTPPAPLSGLHGWNADIYLDLGDQPLPKFKKAPKPSVPTAPHVRTIGHPKRRLAL